MFHFSTQNLKTTTTSSGSSSTSWIPGSWSSLSTFVSRDQDVMLEYNKALKKAKEL